MSAWADKVFVQHAVFNDFNPTLSRKYLRYAPTDLYGEKGFQFAVRSTANDPIVRQPTSWQGIQAKFSSK